MIEQRFDGVPHQHDDGQDPQDGPIGDEQAFDSSHDEAERVMPPAGEKPRGHEYEGRKGQPEEDEKNGKADENPADELGLGCTGPVMPGDHHHHDPQDQVDDRKERNQHGNAREDVVKDGQELEMLFILIQEGLLQMRLG